MIGRVDELWNTAGESIDLAISDLKEIRGAYRHSSLDPQIVFARIAALDSKISALNDIMTNPRAYPWSKDGL